MLKKTLITIIVLGSFVFLAFRKDGTSHLHGPAESKSSAETFEPIIVLELFTSQGCSSCPPADALLGKVEKDYPGNIFTLSYHVDYWNYIGWKDPFSRPEYTRKQKEYASKFHSQRIYTPQLVINGKEHLVGSNSGKLYGKLLEYGKKRALNKIVLSDIDLDGQKVSFAYEVLGDIRKKEIKAFVVLEHRETQVKRGENRNRTLANHNIVVAEKPMNQINGTKNLAFLHLPEMVRPDEQKYLILLVQDSSLEITGAIKVAI